MTEKHLTRPLHFTYLVLSWFQTQVILERSDQHKLWHLLIYDKSGFEKKLTL